MFVVGTAAGSCCVVAVTDFVIFFLVLFCHVVVCVWGLGKLFFVVVSGLCEL